MVRASGLFAFVREDERELPLMLFAGHAEDLAQAADPGHPYWADALRLGANALHVHFLVPRRTARVLGRVERACEQPDTATRWADRSGRWDKPFADRVANAPEPLVTQLLGWLVGSQARSTLPGA